MAEKNYEAYHAAINALREFASRKGWSIASEKEIDYGYQIVVFDGITKNPVDFFPSGKILVQGKPGALRTELLAWRQERSPASSSKYEKMQNLNSLLAWGHARALENVLEKVSCNLAIADQFGNESVLQNALLKKGRQIKLEQRPRAEADTAVAAASILARANFVQVMEQLSIRLGRTLPKGAYDPSIITVAREIVAKGGRDALAEVAKLHFKTTQKILQGI